MGEEEGTGFRVPRLFAELPKNFWGKLLVPCIMQAQFPLQFFVSSSDLFHLLNFLHSLFSGFGVALQVCSLSLARKEVARSVTRKVARPIDKDAKHRLHACLWHLCPHVSDPTFTPTPTNHTYIQSYIGHDWHQYSFYIFSNRAG